MVDGLVDNEPLQQLSNKQMIKVTQTDVQEYS
jgi:hypothetical protein